MEHRTFCDTSLAVVGLAAHARFNVHADAEVSTRESTIDTLLLHGGTVIDTGHLYGAAEALVADAILDRRSPFFIIDRLRCRTRAEGEATLENSLGRFGRLEAVTIHNGIGFREHLPFINELKDKQRIGAIGVSQYLPEQLEDLLPLLRGREVDYVSIPYSPLEREAEKRLLPEADSSGVAVFCQLEPAVDRVFGCPPPDETLTPLHAFGVVSWPQAIVKWVLSEPQIKCVTVAVENGDYLAELCEVAKPPWFSGDERTYLRQLADQYCR